MSLLMDALKRAETSKQEAARANSGKDAAPSPAETLSLEPIAAEPAKPATSPLPELAKHLDAVDADLSTTTHAEAPTRTRPAPPPATTAADLNRQSGRDTVRNAFAAKQPAISKGPLWLALGTLGIAGIAIGAYVWYQLNAMNSNTLAPASPPSRAATLAPSIAPAAPEVPANPAPAVTTADQESMNISQNTTEERQVFAPPRRAARTPLTGREAPPNAPIHLARTRTEPDAGLLRGHASVQRNDLESARRDFEQALQRDPNNTDALLALAAIAQRQGRPGDAEGLYQRAMVANPSEPAVQAAMLNGSIASADPQNTESRLKTLLASQPESAPLNFSLGNLYARQKRWSEAQQVYFNAVASESDNPDYLFNLAVSLDHLRQGRPAAQHYRLALEAAERRPAAFDREQVRKRLAELQPERQP